MKYATLFVQLRKKLGMTQQELADKIGLPQPVVARWESGKVKPQRRNLIKLAGGLGLDADQLIYRPYEIARSFPSKRVGKK